MTRRLCTYLAIDTSGSMRGEPIVAVNSGLRALLSSLRANPYAIDSVHLSITTFDSNVVEVMPMTALIDVQMPEIQCPQSGGTMLGEALEHIHQQALRDTRKATDSEKGDWAPILVVLTDGKPTDTLAFNEVIPKIRNFGFAKVIVCAAGSKADPQQMRSLTDHVVTLDTMDAAGFAAFFEWVSASFAMDSKSRGTTDDVDLPPPPAELNILA